MGKCTHVPVPWQYMGNVMHLCRHIADCNMWLAVKGLQYTDITPDGEDDVPNCAPPWVHGWWVSAVGNARVPQFNLQMGDIVCNYEANPKYCTFANSWSIPCREHSTCLYLCTVLLLRLVHET